MLTVLRHNLQRSIRLHTYPLWSFYTKSNFLQQKKYFSSNIDNNDKASQVSSEDIDQSSPEENTEKIDPDQEPADWVTEKTMEEYDEEIKETEAKILAFANQKGDLVFDKSNIMKRHIHDIQNAQHTGIKSLALKILSLHDNLQQATEECKKYDNGEEYEKLGKNVSNMILEICEKYEIKPFDSLGKQFNPEYHEATFTVPPSMGNPNEIIHESKKGYMKGDQLLRAAEVGIIQPEDE